MHNPVNADRPADRLRSTLGSNCIGLLKIPSSLKGSVKLPMDNFPGEATDTSSREEQCSVQGYSNEGFIM